MNSNFRDDADHGVWVALLLPIAIGVSNYKSSASVTPTSSSSTSSWSLFFLSTCFAIHSLYLAKTLRILPSSRAGQKEKREIKKSSTFANSIFVAVSGIFQFLWFPWHTVVINSLTLSAFIFYLPKLFQNFRKSFTFGEGCLVLQSLLLFVSRSDKILSLESKDGITRYFKFSRIKSR